jgi:hypothetical protein
MVSYLDKKTESRDTSTRVQEDRRLTHFRLILYFQPRIS